ncbi:hypothetical protein, partial [Streptomyces griseoruber]|uniref:hypothetical protein n=1 Tax=Streptomyces griseoruber TaxID=1943 RepID=UPI001B806608
PTYQEALLSCTDPRAITRTGTLFDQTSPAFDKRMASHQTAACWPPHMASGPFSSGTPSHNAARAR